MLPDSISRRQVLRGVAGSVGTLAVAGQAAASAPDRYNVGTKSPAAERAARRNAQSIHRVLNWENGTKTISARYSEEAVENLRKRRDVRYVEEDGLMHAIAIDADDSEVPWGVDRVDAEKVHANGETGGDNSDGEKGADIAIIDTGIDSDHSDLEANLGEGSAFTECTENCNCFPFACGNDNSCNESWDDDNDHGTHCAGIADAANNGDGVVGVSTEATLHAVKVLDCSGSGSYSDVAAGIEHVADKGWDVGSLSLGGDKSSAVEDAVEYAYGKGVLLVAAAGNDGSCTDCVGYPAAEPEVIAVSATSSDDSLASFSSTGPEVELAAPGEDIYSTVPGGYATFSGTSMACPHVSGGGGQLMDNGYSHTDARSQLKNTAEDIGLSSNEQGSGLLDVEAAVGGGSDDTNSTPEVDSLSATEVETAESDAEFDVDWQVSDSDGNLSAIDLSLTDDTDDETEDTASISIGGDSASGTTRLVAAGDDGSGNSYTVDLDVTDSDGATTSDTASVSETEDTSGGDNPPTIDNHDITEAGSPNPHLEITVNWGVSDTDGDLSLVRVTADDADGSTFSETHTTSVSGSNASGTDQFKFKHASGETADVTIHVEDGSGNSASHTEQVTE